MPVKPPPVASGADRGPARRHQERFGQPHVPPTPAASTYTCRSYRRHSSCSPDSSRRRPRHRPRHSRRHDHRDDRARHNRELPAGRDDVAPRAGRHVQRRARLAAGRPAGL